MISGLAEELTLEEGKPRFRAASNSDAVSTFSATSSFPAVYEPPRSGSPRGRCLEIHLIRGIVIRGSSDFLYAKSSRRACNLCLQTPCSIHNGRSASTFQYLPLVISGGKQKRIFLVMRFRGKLMYARDPFVSRPMPCEERARQDARGGPVRRCRKHSPCRPERSSYVHLFGPGNMAACEVDAMPHDRTWGHKNNRHLKSARAFCGRGPRPLYRAVLKELRSVDRISSVDNMNLTVIQGGILKRRSHSYEAHSRGDRSQELWRHRSTKRSRQLGKAQVPDTRRTCGQGASEAQVRQGQDRGDTAQVPERVVTVQR
jgi:hypothetical protein